MNKKYDENLKVFCFKLLPNVVFDFRLYCKKHGFKQNNVLMQFMVDFMSDEKTTK